MRALVTGDRGFVGRHLRSALEGRGYEVRGVDIVDPDYPEDCRKFFRESDDRFDLIVHCAAVVGGRSMIDGEPLKLAAEDLSIDAEMFRYALRTRPGRVVYFSSSAAYPVGLQGETARRPLRESDITLDGQVFGTPDATYGWVKLTGERMAFEANKEGIPTHVFRPFSGYGSDQALDYPFPAIVLRALQHRADDPFFVWGHPDSTRDWVHIDDVVGAVLAHLDGDVYGPANICTGVATSFSSLAKAALAAAGRPEVEVIGDRSKPMGVFHRVGDPERMREVYEPVITIARGIEMAIAAGLTSS